MLSKTAPKYNDVEFNFSGFGEFGGVKDNPTTHLVNHIRENASSYQNDFRVGETEVVKVAAEDCITYIGEIMSVLEKKQTIEPTCRQVLIHLGVAGGSKAVSLELHGYNDATFRIPDVRNYQPMGKQINEIMPLEHYYRSMIPIRHILESLKGKHKVQESVDPGRYICNYIYYLSMTEGYTRQIPSIFIHVPSFDVMTKEEQLAFLQDFLIHLKAFYCKPEPKGETV